MDTITVININGWRFDETCPEGKKLGEGTVMGREFGEGKEAEVFFRSF
jgi:hypothetical protein